MPPSLALTFMQTLEQYCGFAWATCLDWRPISKDVSGVEGRRGGQLTLRNNTDIELAERLDLIVWLGRLGTQDEKQHLGLGLDLVSGLLVKFKNIRPDGLLRVRVHDDGLLILNLPTVADVYLDQLTDKVFHSKFIAVPLGREDHETPTLELGTNFGKFLPTKVPFAVTGSKHTIGRTVTITNLRSIQNTTFGLRLS